MYNYEDAKKAFKKDLITFSIFIVVIGASIIALAFKTTGFRWDYENITVMLEDLWDFSLLFVVSGGFFTCIISGVIITARYLKNNFLMDLGLFIIICAFVGSLLSFIITPAYFIVGLIHILKARKNDDYYIYDNPIYEHVFTITTTIISGFVTLFCIGLIFFMM